jgi:hypothetical protein
MEIALLIGITGALGGIALGLGVFVLGVPAPPGTAAYRIALCAEMGARRRTDL